IRNQQVGGSTPPVGSITFKGITATYAVIPFSIVNHKSRRIKAKYLFSAASSKELVSGSFGYRQQDYL
ncbi:MAG: hypothetical protein KJO61_06375, partial [Deltaproteobacteria bacterium]|nr:hypothetical protein [Deltaproteobacteria bacterium]